MTERKARSVRIHELGGPEVLRIEDVVVPSPGLGEVRLNVHAIGLNRTEITLRSGRSPAKPSLPTVIGFEAAGVIDEVGQGVEGWHPGDRVALIPAYGAAQYAFYGTVALAPARSLVAIPESMTFEQAAATWVAQFIAVCRKSKWSRHLTKSPFLALLAMAGSKAAYKIISACSNAVSG
jgi:NADPH:quinone reductase-like Zn-dependent oxidoreductase